MTVQERGSIQSSVEQMRVSLERSRTEGKDLLIHQLDETRLETAALRKRLQVNLLICLHFKIFIFIKHFRKRQRG